MNDARNIVAGGGGSVGQEEQVWARFAALVGGAGRVLNLPWASPDLAELAHARWASTTLALHGIARVTTVTTLEPSERELEQHDGLMIGGGNTYLLLQRLRASGFDRAIARAVARGLPCYGGSAGAIVFGAHIGTAAHLDTNSVGLRELAGLDLFEGHALWCHYQSEDESRIIGFAAQHRLPVVALPENAGVTLAPDRSLCAIGPGAVLRWTVDGRCERVPPAPAR
jgi:dipeptidase E